MIITIACQKGGTGKSTTTAALAQAAAHRGISCLAIDLDPQGNLSYFAGSEGGTRTSYDALTGAAPIRDTIQHTGGGLDIIPASWDLQTVTTSPGSAHRLREALQPIRGQYEMVLIDTPPTAGELQYNALMAADGLIIPVQADVTGLQGLYQMTDTAQQIRRAAPGLHILGYILTRHGGRSTLSRQMADQIKAAAEGRGVPYMGAIREAVAIREAQTLQQSLYEYAPTSKPAQDYMALYETISAINY